MSDILAINGIKIDPKPSPKSEIKLIKLKLTQNKLQKKLFNIATVKTQLPKPNKHWRFVSCCGNEQSNWR